MGSSAKRRWPSTRRWSFRSRISRPVCRPSGPMPMMRMGRIGISRRRSQLVVDRSQRMQGTATRMKRSNLAPLRIGGDEEPQRRHHAEQRREERRREHDVAGHASAVPAVVVLEDSPAEHPDEDRAGRHPEKHEPVPKPRLLRGDGGRRQEDDAISDEVQVLGGLLGHRRAVAMDLRGEAIPATAGRIETAFRTITLVTTQCSRVQVGQVGSNTI